MTKRRHKKIDDALLRKLWVSRLTEAEIAKKMGHRPYTLRRRAIKLGLPRSRRKMWRDQA